MANEMYYQAAEIENNAKAEQRKLQELVSSMRRRIRDLRREADSAKNESLHFKTVAVTSDLAADVANRMRMATKRDLKFKNLQTAAKEMERQLASEETKKKFEIREMYNAARKLRVQA